MICVENFSEYGIEAAIRGMRNPMNSWAKSDTQYTVNEKCQVVCTLGKDDYQLMLKLAAAGPEHRKYMRMMAVTMDITAPLYWWKEFETYKVGVTCNSTSTMHKIHAKEFTMDDFSCEHLMTDVFAAGSEIIDQNYTKSGLYVTPESLLKLTIACLNNYRIRYLNTRDKEWWWQMIQLLPTSYNQRRTVCMNYEVLRNIYWQRRGHKLDEWRTFCEKMEANLRYPKLITITSGEM